MIKWIRSFKESTVKTKYFFFNVVVYMLMIIIPFIWIYARIDFVRSGEAKRTEQHDTSLRDK